MHTRWGSNAASSVGRSAPGSAACWPRAKGWSPVSRACASMPNRCPASAASVPAVAASAAAPPAGVACARRLRCSWPAGVRPAASCSAESVSRSAGAWCRLRVKRCSTACTQNPSRHGRCCRIHLCLSTWLPAAQWCPPAIVHADARCRREGTALGSAGRSAARWTVQESLCISLVCQPSGQACTACVCAARHWHLGNVALAQVSAVRVGEQVQARAPLYRLHKRCHKAAMSAPQTWLRRGHRPNIQAEVLGKAGGTQNMQARKGFAHSCSWARWGCTQLVVPQSVTLFCERNGKIQDCTGCCPEPVLCGQARCAGLHRCWRKTSLITERELQQRPTLIIQVEVLGQAERISRLCKAGGPITERGARQGLTLVIYFQVLGQAGGANSLQIAPQPVH